MFVDLKKAFDSVDRNLLLTKLRAGGVNKRLVKALRNFYDKTNLLVDDEPVYTNVGVVQGGISSPLTFNILIDVLIRELNNVATCYALADDIVIHAADEDQLKNAIKKLEEITAELDIAVSKDKSAILEVRRGMRRILSRPRAHGYPVVT